MKWVLFGVLFGIILSFFIVQLFIYVICLCFGINYVFMYGCGIYIILIFLNIIFGRK